MEREEKSAVQFATSSRYFRPVKISPEHEVEDVKRHVEEMIDFLFPDSLRSIKPFITRDVPDAPS